MIRKIIRKWRQYRHLPKDTRVENNCIIATNSSIGKNVRIGKDSQIGNNVTIGDNVIIGQNVRLSNITIGSNSQIESGVICTGAGEGRITIGCHSYVGIYNILDWSDNITIGDYVHIAGPSTGLWTHSSADQALQGISLQDKALRHRPVAPIRIADRVYIGGNCTIYPGIKIETNVIVAPNSAVSKNLASGSLYGGVPAKELKRI